MKVRLCVCWVVVCVFAMLFLTLAGCKSADTVAAATGSGSDLSGPPVFNARFQTREPRKCSQVKSPPNVSQAIALIQCQREHMEAHNVWLTTDVKAEMGSARDFIYRTDQGWPEIDTSAKLIPLRGSWTVYNCAGIGEDVNGIKGKNCMKSVVAEATGACWKTTFGDWKCDESGPGDQPVWNLPPPPPTY